MGVVSGSRTRKGTLPADRGASAAAAPAASAATPLPASSVEPPVRGAVVPQAAAGVPSPATVRPSHASAAEVTGAIGPPPPPKPPLAWWGVWAGPGGAPQTEPWPGGETTQWASSANPPFPPITFNSISCAWAVRMAPALSDADASPRRRAMKRATRTSCVSLRASTTPTLSSDTTFHSSLRAGCRAPLRGRLKGSGPVTPPALPPFEACTNTDRTRLSWRQRSPNRSETARARAWSYSTVTGRMTPLGACLEMCAEFVRVLMGMYRPCTARAKLSTYRGKMPSLCA